MLYVKIMSGEDMPDSDPFKNYSIIPVSDRHSLRFIHNAEYSLPQENKPTHQLFELIVTGPDGTSEAYPLMGNAYVMTESGKTIASHGS